MWFSRSSSCGIVYSVFDYLCYGYSIICHCPLWVQIHYMIYVIAEVKSWKVLIVLLSVSAFVDIMAVKYYSSFVLLSVVGVVCIPHVTLILRDYLIVRLNSLIFFNPPPRPSSLPADFFDVVVIVGALSVGQVPVHVVRELCKSTKPGGNMFYAVSTADLMSCC